MPRLIDSIRAEGKFEMPVAFVDRRSYSEWQDYSKSLWPQLLNPDLPVLLIDNVAEYYYHSDQEYWDFRNDFPNMAPPFPQFWVEHKLPKKIYSKEVGETDFAALVPNGRAGCLITAYPIELVGDYFPEDFPPSPEGTKWVLACELWIDYGKQGEASGCGPHSPAYLCIDAEGRILQSPWMRPFVSGEGADYLKKDYIGWFRPALLAVCFLHCKNVVLTDVAVDKPLAKKWHSKTGKWPTSYKTLVIEPLKEILRREGKSDTVGLAKAMHICRGHFADYREGRGLFGKYKKLVWIPMTVRGNKGLKPAPREMEIKI